MVSKKQKQNASFVEVQKQPEQTKPVEAENTEVNPVAPSNVDNMLLRPPVLPDGLKGIDPEKIKMADGFFPASAMLEYMAQSQKWQEQTHAITTALLKNADRTGKILEVIAGHTQQQNQQPTTQPTTPAPQQQAGFFGLPPEILKMVLGNSQPTSGISETDKMFIEFGKRAMENQIAIGDAVTKKILSDAAVKVASS